MEVEYRVSIHKVKTCESCGTEKGELIFMRVVGSTEASGVRALLNK